MTQAKSCVLIVARHAGCDGFIAKPCDITTVGNAVAEVLARGRGGLDALHALQPVPDGGRQRRKVAST